MQLKKRKSGVSPTSVAGTLAAATCALVGLPASAEVGDGWKVDSAVLYYSESDRVSAVEPVVKAKRTFADDSSLDFKLTVDSLTGASHNGAMVSRSGVQTFTSPSGGTTFTAAPGEVPLDDSFKDTRVAFSTQYTRPLNRTLRATGGANISNEYDFSSMAINAGLMWDLNQKNTTLTLAFSHESDSIDAVGGTPVGLSLQSDRERRGSSEDKTVDDLLLGVTQVMGRRWISQLNYTLSDSSGYHTDPYKVVTVVDALGRPEEAENLGGTDIGSGDAQVHEQRPDQRTRHALYWENRYTFDNDDVLALGYRYMTDDWGIRSHTIDLKYRWVRENGWYLQPHVRYYTQSAADFWYESINEQQYDLLKATAGDASGDYRLGKLTDATVGLKVGRELAGGREWAARLEFFQQSGDTDAAEVDALIAQVGYTFFW